MLRCPDPTCRAAVGFDMVNSSSSEEDKQKYARYLRRSYIEDNRKVPLFPCKFVGSRYLIYLVARH